MQIKSVWQRLGGKLSTASLLCLVALSTSTVPAAPSGAGPGASAGSGAAACYDPYEHVDLVCRLRDDTPFTTPGVGAFVIADCWAQDGTEYEFILPRAGGV